MEVWIPHPAIMSRAGKWGMTATARRASGEKNVVGWRNERIICGLNRWILGRAD
ncbi:MAG: hypothetical protein ACYSUP_01030 [Planctomycetota bacterium]